MPEDEALEQAKELAVQSLQAQYGESGRYVASWSAIDARHMLGHDGFVLIYILPRTGVEHVAIGANAQEMWLEKIF